MTDALADARLLGYLPAVVASATIALDVIDRAARVPDPDGKIAHVIEFAVGSLRVHLIGGEPVRAAADLAAIATRAGVTLPAVPEALLRIGDLVARRRELPRRTRSDDPVEDGLLRAIAGGDDASRDVYADWLESRGDLARAELARPARADRWLADARAAATPSAAVLRDSFDLGCAAGDLFMNARIADSLVFMRADAPQLPTDDIARVAAAIAGSLAQLGARFTQPPEIVAVHGTATMRAYGNWQRDVEKQLRRLVGWPPPAPPSNAPHGSGEY